MKTDKKLIQPFIKHDDNASQDGKILKMYFSFRKLAKTMEREELESFVAHGAYAIFWRILEFMRNNKLPVDNVEIISDNLRIKTEYVEQILNDFDLFHIQNGEYVSDRLLRDLQLQEEKSKSARESAKTGWLLSAFNKAYIEFFGQEPVLSSAEIESLKKYSEKVPNLKDNLRDILYTLKNLKFETDINFKPCANWLLKDNNLGKLLNGEFGKLKHKKTEKEIAEEEKAYLRQQEEQNKPSELELKIETISGKGEALDLITSYPEPKDLRGRLLINPVLRRLMDKFDITDNEIKEEYAKKNEKI